MPIRPENRDLYSADWPAIRQEVLDREGHRCRKCRVPNHVWGIRWRAGTFTVLSLPYTVNAAAADAKFRPCENEHDAAAAAEDLLPGLHIKDRDLWRRSDHGETCHRSGRLVRIVLTVAHLDHDPTNNGTTGNRPNLQALCQRCHNLHDGPHRRETAGRTRDRRRGQQRLFEKGPNDGK